MTTVTADVPTPIGRLHTVLVEGDPAATPLVLGHGVFLDSAIWDGVLPGLGDRRILLVDGPGHGGSDRPPPAWSLDDHAAALVTVLDAHGLDRPALAGHSWGGMVALRVALAHPERVAALGLVNTPLRATTGRGRLSFVAQRAFLQTVGPAPLFARAAARALYGSQSLREQPELSGRLVARMAAHPGAMHADTVRAVILDPTDQLDRLAALTVPTVVVAGEEDYAFGPLDRCALTGRARIRIVPGGHVSPEEQPAAVAAALAELFDP